MSNGLDSFLEKICYDDWRGLLQNFPTDAMFIFESSQFMIK